MIWERLISFVGIFFILGIAWLLSNNRKKINVRVVIWGLILQMSFAFIILKTEPGRSVFRTAKSVIVRILGFTDDGAAFMFGNLYRANEGLITYLEPSNLEGHVLLLDAAAASRLTFGSTVKGRNDTLTINLENTGTAPVAIQGVIHQDSIQFAYISPELPFTIPVKAKSEFKFLFSPREVGIAKNEIKFSDASGEEISTVVIQAEGVETPTPALTIASNSMNLTKFKDLGIIFAIHILPTIIFFAALMSVLYHFGVMQRLVHAMAWIMSRTMRTSGAESLSAASNIFVGQTEAPLVIKPYVNDMTKSELMAIMTGGFATIAGGVMAAYVRFGVDAGHLMAASVMSAPAALVMAKIIFPETEHSKTAGKIELKVKKNTANIIDAAASGAGDGLRLAVNVGAMLMAFISLIALFNYGLGHIDELINALTFHATSFDWNITLKEIFGIIFAPFAFFMGVDFKDIMSVGHLLGTKISINELVAYLDLAQLEATLSPRSFTIATYALCGFANFSSIAIQVGGIASIAPGRRSDLARLGFRAMIGGALASWLTATIAGLLL